ncbi:hypothetical protein VRU48_14745 [Pedobacter sp. KR3-3]|uniref:DUF4157 domain-containing protein n=1 Tax=Pedobacter albus TaxID=3113905 RepID=A0ABU7IA74_9SPHI|nr:hypothetical protein [Pedobacter sp. KR3-3]MEE1946380.1 hypothetical protein [Pedobacter sp. KR3-3]
MRPWIVVWSKLPASGMALFPFILVKNHALKTDRSLINHEQIHLRQQLELLVIPFYVFYLLNYLINLLRFRNHHQAYLQICFEREAFANELDFDYLKQRKLYR